MPSPHPNTTKLYLPVPVQMVYLVLLWLCLVGCNSDITAQTEDLHQFRQIQGQLNFVLLIPTVPDEFQLDSLSADSSGFNQTGIAAFLPDDSVATLRYLDDTKTREITVIQYTLPQNVGAGVPTGVNVQPLKVGNAVFPMRVSTVLGETQRQLHYQRDNLYIQIITNTPPESLSDETLAELADSLHPLAP